VENTSLNSNVFNNSTIVVGEDEEEFHSKPDLTERTPMNGENDHCKSVNIDKRNIQSKNRQINKNFFGKAKPSSNDPPKRAFSVRISFSKNPNFN
jgi:hypothetical protein